MPDEIVVTGERVDRSLRETPSSVVVTTAEMIEAQAGADRVEQLLAMVPNLQLGAGGQGPTIRGQDTTGVLQDLAAGLGGTRPRTTLQIDGRGVGYHEFVFGIASVWDVEQVEVFRSPQTTTQGRNSIAGAIFVRTSDPSYAWEGRARAIAGNYDMRQGSAVVSGPLIKDQLAFRIAGDVRRGRPSTEIASQRIVGVNPNRDDYDLLRFKLLAEPRAFPGARLETSYVHLESAAPQIEAVKFPFEARRDPLPGYGVYTTNVDSLTAVLDYEIAPSLISTTTLSNGDSFVQRFAPLGLGQAKIDTRDFSAESVLSWKPQGPVRLLGGVHHSRARQDQFIDLSAVIGNGDFSDRQRSLGLFGEATLRPLARLALTGGLRYQRDTQDRHGFLGTPGFGLPIDFDEAFDAWLPKLSAAYDLTDDLTAGILVQRAYHPGGTTINFDTGEQDDFGAETLWSYEIFARAALANSRATIGVNIFYNDISNAQRGTTRAFRAPSGAIAFWVEINNVPAAESYGAELSLDWRASRRFSLRAGLGLLETKIVETLSPADPIRGKDFQRSPGLSAAGSIDWQPVERLRLSAQLRHNSGYFSNDANALALRIDPATVLDARAAYTAGSFTLFGYARNVFDAFHLRLLTSPASGSANDPRELGLGLETRF